MKRKLSPEDVKIIEEDSWDLYVQARQIVWNYVDENQFADRDKAILMALANMVGNFFTNYNTDEARSEAIDVFVDIVSLHLKNM